jgi:molecular chaperone HtpG
MSKHEFEAEMSELMGLIVNSFYSNKDIFLRELVSNASDALDKIRHESLTNQDVLKENNDMKIRIIPDKDNNTLTIEDDGVGMTEKDLINNLGTIARSGTKNFTKYLQEKGEKTDMNLIGQFGVGFYSAFLVANQVEVYTKTHDDDEFVWRSTASKEYTIDRVTEPTLKRGSRLVLHLKDDAKEYLEETTLKDIINKHSQYVDYNIELMTVKEVEEEVEDDEVNEEEVNEEDDKPVIEDVTDEDTEKASIKKVITKTVKEMEHLNKQKPIWCRDKSTVTDEEYKEFYKSITKDYDEEAAHLHFSVEGNIEFSSIIYLPGRAPFDMFNGGENKDKTNVKLYVKKVFIMDDCEKLIPEWLSFIKGVVDCKDLPLNVSRELLQQSKTLSKINSQLVKKSIDMMVSLSEDKPDEYRSFYNAFHKNIKLGIHTDEKNRGKLSKLLRYNSLKHRDSMISLDDYVGEMKDGQDSIYFIGGESIQSVENSPFLEKLKDNGFDVLFYTDPIDEYVSKQLNEYDDKKMVSASSKSLNLSDDNEEETKLKEEFGELAKKMKEVLGDKIQNINVSTRVIDSPCCLLTDDNGYSANMQRILKAQALNNNDMLQYMMKQKEMEINPKNKIIIDLNMKHKKNKNDPIIGNITHLLYDISLLTSGFTIEDPSAFASKFNKMIQLGLSIDNDDSDDEDIVIEDPRSEAHPDGDAHPPGGDVVPALKKLPDEQYIDGIPLVEQLD